MKKNHTFIKTFIIFMAVSILMLFLCLSFTKIETENNGKIETYWEFNGKRI